MRISLADSIWLLFGAACILGIAYSNRPISYSPSPVIEQLSVGKLLEDLQSIENGARATCSNSNGPLLSMRLLTSNEITPQKLVDHLHQILRLKIEKNGVEISSEPILRDNLTVGHLLRWQANHNFGFIEIIHLNVGNADYDSKPNWQQHHELHINRMEYWHPNAWDDNIPNG